MFYFGRKKCSRVIVVSIMIQNFLLKLFWLFVESRGDRQKGCKPEKIKMCLCLDQKQTLVTRIVFCFLSNKQNFFSNNLQMQILRQNQSHITRNVTFSIQFDFVCTQSKLFLSLAFALECVSLHLFLFPFGLKVLFYNGSSKGQQISKYETENMYMKY